MLVEAIDCLTAQRAWQVDLDREGRLIATDAVACAGRERRLVCAAVRQSSTCRSAHFVHLRAAPARR